MSDQYLFAPGEITLDVYFRFRYAKTFFWESSKSLSLFPDHFRVEVVEGRKFHA